MGSVVVDCVSVPSHQTVVFVSPQRFVLESHGAKPWPTQRCGILVTFDQVPRAHLLQLGYLETFLFVNRKEVFDLFTFCIDQTAHRLARDDLSHLPDQRHQWVDQLHLQETFLFQRGQFFAKLLHQILILLLRFFSLFNWVRNVGRVNQHCEHVQDRHVQSIVYLRIDEIAHD